MQLHPQLTKKRLKDKTIADVKYLISFIKVYVYVFIWMKRKKEWEKEIEKEIDSKQ